MSELVVTILMPCLNEAETLAFCVSQAVAAIRDTGVAGEVVVADNGAPMARSRLRLTTGRVWSRCRCVAMERP